MESLEFFQGFFYFYRMQITGIILAGGKSTRMGTDKALLKTGGETLLEKAVNLCRTVCSQILISSNSPSHEITGLSRIDDEFYDCGPMSGIYSCLRQAENEWCFVISVDSAFVSTGFVSYLISLTEKADAVVPFHDNGKEPLIALYRKSTVFQFLNQLETGNYKMYFLLERFKTKLVDVSDWKCKQPNLFHNMNSPDDLIP